MADKEQNLKGSYDSRFISDYLGGSIYNDPVIAIVELITNAWDAGARNVKIVWPLSEDEPFSIVDDGHGLITEEFSMRWTKLSYNRINTQGIDVYIPKDNKIPNKRNAYGRNGKGRFSAFCFGGNTYFVETKKDQSHSCYKVQESTGQNPLLYTEISLPKPSLLFHKSHGTAVYANKANHVGISEDKIRSEIGMRFLTDPYFTVHVNDQAVIFKDIASEHIKTLAFIYKSQNIIIKVINTQKSDKTTHQHGVAWHVNNRLVGKCSWDGMRNDNILDGRTALAKKYTFIVQANAVLEHVKADWTGFNNTDEMLEFYDLTKSTILSFFSDLSKESRAETTKCLKDDNQQKLCVVGPISYSFWSEFIEEVQIKCPTFNYDQLNSIAKILVDLEVSKSQYSLLHRLSECNSDDFDDLNEILKDWNIKSAKAVLDVIQSRLSLIEQIRSTVHKKSTQEVQELQLLFSKGLWIFGPEFESIEYTSNQGMTKVLHNLFKKDIKGSRNRPDFVVLPDSSVSLYGHYNYDEDGSENEIKSVLIIELKKPGVKLNSAEKEQCWKYVKELFSEGAISPSAKVHCYLLGETIDPLETRDRSEYSGQIIIRSILFDTILKRAETRMLNLHKKIENAPFLEDFNHTEFLEKNTIDFHEQLTLKEMANG